MILIRPHALSHYAPNPFSTVPIRCLDTAPSKSTKEEAEVDQAIGEKRKLPIVYQSRHAEVWDSESEYVLSLDLPGIKSGDITIEAEEQTLRVTAERKSKNYSTHFHKQFSFDKKSVDIAALVAKLSDGVLTLKVPKKEIPSPIQVAVIGEASSTETDGSDTLSLTIDLPGVKPADVNVEFHDGALSIQADRKKSGVTSTLRRRLILDADKIDPSAFQGYLSDGVLTIKVPRKKASAAVTSKLSFVVNAPSTKSAVTKQADGEKEVVVETVVEKEDADAEGSDQ